jgi:hypothetical protein
MTNNKKMISAKEMTITFTRTAEFKLDFKEWYCQKKDDYHTEADALAQWGAMCSNADKQEDIEDDNQFGWSEVEDRCNELEEEYRTDAYDSEMADLIEAAEEAFGEIGVAFYRDWSCCNTCGHSEAEAEAETEAEKKNYVFYHGQDNDRLRKGDREVDLAFNFDEETKVKVLELIATMKNQLHWAGEDHTRMFLTCDDALMAKHIKSDAERQVRMEEMAKQARRDALVKELAEMDKI